MSSLDDPDFVPVPPRPRFHMHNASIGSDEDSASDSDHDHRRPPARTPAQPSPLPQSRRSSIPRTSTSRGPPPSSFAFPFQSYPGNPDPGTPIPGFGRRRYSFDASISSQPTPHQTSSDPSQIPRSSSAADFTSYNRSATSLYRHSAAGAIVSSTASDTGHGTTATFPRTGLRSRSNSQTFRSPFLAPTSRPSSSLWAPPSAFPTRLLASSSRAHAAPSVNPSAASSVVALALPKAKPPFPSTALPAKLTRHDKPWLAQRDRGSCTSWWLTFLSLMAGAAVAAFLCWHGVTTLDRLNPHQLCIVLDDSFDTLDTDNTWTRDVEMSGFGNSEFQMTTDFDNNSYVQNGNLYIMPTLTSDVIGTSAVIQGGNFTLPHCTAPNTNSTACTVQSNGKSIINPVMSARINTKGKFSIQYGKVEVRAKLPRGDWLWPAIWMLSEDESYGPWPISGELDIMEARGNSPSYPAQGVDVVRSSIHYGPLPSLTNTLFGWFSSRRDPFDDGFHTYGMEWTDKFMRFYVDSRVRQTLVVSTKREKDSFWSRAKFPSTAVNGTDGPVVGVGDPWAAGGWNAPFDRAFYLVIDLAAGGTSGWFPDGVGGKPWQDESQNAMLEFAMAQSDWYATWPQNPDDRAFRIDHVKMWSLC